MKFEELKKAVLAGKVFVYPTDTVYGLGCNAEDGEAVEKIKEIKGRDKDKPLSIIAPSVDWIKENCDFDSALEKYLPGPYTLILKKKNPEFLKQVASGDTLGVRIPDSKFCFEIQKCGVAFVTTSVNKSGENPAIDISDIDKEIIDKVDVVIESEEELSGKPSSLIINGEVKER
tara:strand:- start:6540 stop:7061 length:522 start_codon:yes stop_codon:yes gene_type:complete